MVVEDQHINAALAQPGDLGARGRTAIHGKEQLHRNLLQAVLHAGLAESVALVHAMRQVAMHRPAERGQKFVEQRGGSHAVHIVVAEDDERLACGVRDEETFDGHLHVWEQKRVGEVL